MQKIIVAASAVAWATSSAPSWAAVCEDLAPRIERGQSDAPARPVTDEDLVRLRTIGPVEMSPDGRSVAFEMRRADPDRNAYCVGIFVLQLGDDPRLIQVDAGGEFIMRQGPQFGMQRYPMGSTAPVPVKWSPDGRWIAYQKSLVGTVQLWRARSDGGEAQPAAASGTSVEEFAWTPGTDGLIFASRPGFLVFDKAVDEEAERGFLYDDRFSPGLGARPLPRDVPLEYQRVSLPSGDIRDASDADIAAVHPAAPSGRSGAERWATSASGALAWIDRAASSKLPSRLHAMVRGSTYACEASACGDVQALWWDRAGKELRFIRREGWAGSRTAIYRWTPGRSAPRVILSSDALIEQCSSTGDQLICAFEDATTPRRLVSIRVADGAMTTILDPNPEFREVVLQPAQRLHWRNDIGLEAFGDLVLPAGHQPGQRHPLVVVGYISRGFLQGGIGDEYPIQLFASRGFAVLSFNRPRDIIPAEASDVDAVISAGLEDWADRRSVNSALERGIDLAISQGAIDPDRIGLTGLSDGAVTVQWALINSRRYAAASASSLSSSTGFMAMGGPARSTLFRRWGMPALTDPNRRLRWSGLSIADNPSAVTTPLLVQTSDDNYVSAVDSYQSLKELDRPVELYVFPGEHHIKWQPAHRLAVFHRNLQWFDFWLMGREDPEPIDPDQYSRWNAMKEAMAKK